MSRKIMIVCGSPKPKGNTNAIVEQVAAAARSAGASVEVIDAPRLQYVAHGCTACDGCQKSSEYRCVLGDQAADVVARMADVDWIVLDTPIYFFAPTAQLRCLTDRMYSLVKFEQGITTCLAGKRLGLIVTAGGGLEDGPASVEDYYQRLAGMMSDKPVASLLVPNVYRADKANIQRQAAAFGQMMAQ